MALQGSEEEGKLLFTPGGRTIGWRAAIAAIRVTNLGWLSNNDADHTDLIESPKERQYRLITISAQAINQYRQYVLAIADPWPPYEPLHVFDWTVQPPPTSTA